MIITILFVIAAVLCVGGVVFAISACIISGRCAREEEKRWAEIKKNNADTREANH